MWNFRFYRFKNKISISKNISKKLNKINSRRGPDGDGIWFSSDYSVCFCHTRLSIIDLSNMGSQPMLSQNGRFIITYNGEIYNYRELRKKHEIKTNGNSDTELLVELINLYGLEKTLDMIDGMYAFALWDKKLKKFYIIRDRFGIKPLYWSKKDGIIVFSSDLRVFRELYTNLDVSIDSVKNFLIHSYIHSIL